MNNSQRNCKSKSCSGKRKINYEPQHSQLGTHYSNYDYLISELRTKTTALTEATNYIQVLQREVLLSQYRSVGDSTTT